jgi:predicted DNA-binding transcriptional regulator AlpA
VTLLTTDEEERLISAREVGRMYGIHQKTAWKWAREDRIPKPVRPFNKWRMSEVLAHLASLEHAELKELAS